MKICVIADDLTGAAEIAGIGHRYGLTTRLVRSGYVPSTAELTVIDTDSRQLAPAEAVVRVKQVVAEARSTAPADALFFKKIDSVLRGPLLAELDAAMDALGKKCALLVPQNPSRGRTIQAGRYAINGVALDQTTFASDPDHPAKTDRVLDLLGTASHGKTVVLDPGSEVPETGICVCGAATPAEVASWACQLDDETLPAGGADFFQAVLEDRGLKVAPPLAITGSEGKALIVCGSASSPSRQAVERAEQEGLCICAMPDILFTAASVEPNLVDAWSDDVVQAFETQRCVIIAARQPAGSTPASSLTLASRFAEVVSQVAARVKLGELLLEGGSTAAAVVNRLCWHEFFVCREAAPGVVQVLPAADRGPLITFKPGSYPWPETGFEKLSRNNTRQGGETERK